MANLNETAFRLLSNNFRSLRIASVPSPGLEAGEMFQVGNLVCIAPEAYATGEKGVGIYAGEKMIVPKSTGVGTDAIAGALAYYDPDTGKVSDATTTNSVKVGVFLEAVSTSDTTALIDFDGISAALGS